MRSIGEDTLDAIERYNIEKYYKQQKRKYLYSKLDTI